MSEFDDPELRRMLNGPAGTTPDVDAAFQRVQGRVRQAKRRRAGALSAAAGVLLVGAATFAAARGDDPGSVRPADTAESTIASSSSEPSATTDDTATTATANTTDTTTAPTTPATTETSTAPSTATTTPATAPPPTSPPSTPTTAAPDTRTFSGVGGSITVRMENGSLTLVASNAASGFATEIQKSAGDRVEVRFESADHRTEIRVDLVGNTMSPEIKES